LGFATKKKKRKKQRKEKEIEKYLRLGNYFIIVLGSFNKRSLLKLP